MIIVRLTGGMGNQMFQYAYGRRAAQVQRTTLKLDLRWFDNQNLRTYDLHHFNINAEIATPGDLAPYHGGGLRRRIHRFIDRKLPFNYRSVVRQRVWHFDPAALRIRRSAYVIGTWQSAKNFAGAEDAVRRDLSVRNRPEGKNAELIEQIRALPAVSVHIRRGDYVSSAQVSAVHGTCSPDYYQRAADRMVTQLGQAHFVLFSDDPAWAGRNIRLPGPTTVIDQNGPGQAHEDMRLMSACKHHIIANSSFSWWGAWLGQNPHKTVIAPKRWFRNSPFDTRDLLPDSWIRL